MTCVFSFPFETIIDRSLVGGGVVRNESQHPSPSPFTSLAFSFLSNLPLSTGPLNQSSPLVLGSHISCIPAIYTSKQDGVEKEGPAESESSCPGDLVFGDGLAGREADFNLLGDHTW